MDESANFQNTNLTNDLTVNQYVDQDNDKISEKGSDNTDVVLLNNGTFGYLSELLLFITQFQAFRTTIR